MTEQDYRADDVTDDGYCPKCGEPLTGLTVAARGYCDTHGWVYADWSTASGRDMREARERLDSLELERERERVERFVAALDTDDEGDDSA